MSADVIVKETDGGKFKVMVNCIQRGIEYTSKRLADQEAIKIREKSLQHKK